MCDRQHTEDCHHRTVGRGDRTLLAGQMIYKTHVYNIIYIYMVGNNKGDRAGPVHGTKKIRFDRHYTMATRIHNIIFYKSLVCIIFLIDK